MAKIAELLGTPPMPWQRDVLDVAYEYDPKTGLPFYGEVDLLVMRQQGKTTIEFAALVDRFVSWQDRQRCAYSAQTGNDARKKLLQDWGPALKQSPLGGMVDQVIRSNGHESIWCKNGSWVETMASLEASGHGFSVNFAMIDEAWKDHDDRREQAIDPAMLTIPDAQKWVVSTAGNETSTYLARKVETGRAAVADGVDRGLCYIEYSVPDDEDPFDIDVLLRYMPALCPTPGACDCSDEWRHTVTQEALLTRMNNMDPAEARRAYANQWNEGSSERVIPSDLWDQVIDPTCSPKGKLSFGVDVLPDQSAAAVCASDGESVEVIESGSGTSWVVDRVASLVETWGGVVVVDGNGPAVSVADDLEDAKVKVRRLTTSEVAGACARFYTAVADGKVRVRPSQVLDDAVAGAAKKPMGDRWMWSRTASANDATPLMAATLAYSRGEEETVPTPFFLK